MTSIVDKNGNKSAWTELRRESSAMPARRFRRSPFFGVMETCSAADRFVLASRGPGPVRPRATNCVGVAQPQVAFAPVKHFYLHSKQFRTSCPWSSWWTRSHRHVWNFATAAILRRRNFDKRTASSTGSYVAYFGLVVTFVTRYIHFP